METISVHHVLPSAVEIRPATTADAEDVYRLIEEYYDVIEVVVRDTRQALLQYLSDAASRIWIAYAGNVLAGCVVLRPLLSMGNAGEVKRLYVKPEYRRRGIAELLMQALEEHARKMGMDRLYLDTKDDLVEAIRFYERSGYERCDRYNDNPQATIFMRKAISAG